MSDTKQGFSSGNSIEAHNDPESHLQKINEDKYDSIIRTSKHEDITEAYAVIISQRGEEYGGTTDRTINTDQSGTTKYTSMFIRFIGTESGNENHPHRGKKDPLLANSKEEFLNLRSIQDTRAIYEPTILGAWVEPGMGNIIKCRKRGNIWYIEEVLDRNHQPYVDFIERMASGGSSEPSSAMPGPPGTYHQSAGNNPGATPYPPSGQRDDPEFKKGACPKALKGDYKDTPTQKTSFKKYTQNDVIEAIKATGQPEHIQRTMFAYISKEQPKFSFPNNNVAGIQTDGGMFKGTTAADYDYQSCFHDKHKHRAFAGFNSLERGMVVFGKIVAGKYSGNFRMPKSDQDTETLVWNYWRGWNLAAKPKELESIKKNGYFTRGGKTYKRDWNAAEKKFKQALEKWDAYGNTGATS